MLIYFTKWQRNFSSVQLAGNGLLGSKSVKQEATPD